jgi:hypothetical protein
MLMTLYLYGVQQSKKLGATKLHIFLFHAEKRANCANTIVCAYEQTVDAKSKRIEQV